MSQILITLRLEDAIQTTLEVEIILIELLMGDRPTRDPRGKVISMGKGETTMGRDLIRHILTTRKPITRHRMMILTCLDISKAMGQIQAHL